MSKHQEPALVLGQNVYTDDGQELGTVRGFDDNGFYVSLGEDVEVPSINEASTGPNAGHMDLMWRCLQCGEMGDIDDFPDTCPSCGAEAEEIYYWTED